MTGYTPYTDAMPETFETEPPQVFVAVLPFPYDKAPLTENARWPHWAVKAKVVKRVRGEAAKAAERLPELGRCRVTLTWFVNTKQRRDVDNIYPTLKALCDGLVDAGVVVDDTPEYMDKLAPVIQYEKGGTARMELRIEMLP